VVDLLLSDGHIPPVNVIRSAHTDANVRPHLGNRKTPSTDANKVLHPVLYSAISYYWFIIIVIIGTVYLT